MKPLLPILLFATLISCSKSNITFNHHWQAEAYHDNQALDHAFTCDPSDYLRTDTIELDNTAVYDSTKFGEHPGSIVFDKGGEVAGNRYYHRLVKQID